jgi:hypothetical protein
VGSSELGGPDSSTGMESRMAPVELPSVLVAIARILSHAWTHAPGTCVFVVVGLIALYLLGCIKQWHQIGIRARSFELPGATWQCVCTHRRGQIPCPCPIGWHRESSLVTGMVV